MQYDITSKLIIEKGNREILHYFLHVDPVSIEVIENLPQELPSVRRSDFLLKVTDRDQQEQLYLIEFQTYWDVEAVKNLMIYTLLAQKKYKNLPLVPTMLLFHEHRTALGEYQDDLFSFRFRLIKMWEQNGEQILNTNSYILYPFIPIMIGDEEITLEAENRLYNSDLDRETKSDLLTSLTIFAGLRSKQLCKILMERRRDLMFESPGYDILMQAVMEKGIEKGMEKGMEQGRIEGMKEGILLSLELKFGDSAEKLANHIKTIHSLEILKKIQSKLRNSSSIQEIENILV